MNIISGKMQMKKTILAAIIIVCLLLLAGCKGPATPTKSVPPSKPEVESKDSCTDDIDCICGGIDKQSGTCFIGNKGYYEKYVDKGKSCPDFCTGIAGNLAVKCVDSRCIQMFECIMDSECDEGKKCMHNKCA
ncbi:hypothetical protein ACFL3V_02120 [Nanoarchaeota archaeon]